MVRHGFRLIAFALTLAAATACAQTPKTSAALTTQSPEVKEVADTLRAMYAAAQKDDLEGFHAVVTPGFYAFDNGQRFEGDALMRLIIDLHGQGAKAVWTVTQPDVHINGNYAWISYVNVGSFQMSATSPVVPTTWLESATLEKQGTWKIAFFHSTRVPS
jgi:ketosteroid isomerase-like protein